MSGKPKSAQHKKELSADRRTFLQNLIASGAGMTLWGLDPRLLQLGAKGSWAPRAMASGAGQLNRKFLLYIHCGSYDGYGLGFFQGDDLIVGEKDPYFKDHKILFPRGVHEKKQITGSVNRYLNSGIKVGPLVLNQYTRVLEPIVQHMAFAVGDRKSIDHATGSQMAHMGSVAGANNPSFTVGFSQVLSNHGYGDSYVLGNHPDHDYALTADMKNVGYLRGTSKAVFEKALSDSPELYRQFPIIEKQAIGDIFTQHTSTSIADYLKRYYRDGVGKAESYKSYSKSISQGLSALPGFSDTYESLRSKMNTSAIEQIYSYLPSREATEIAKTNNVGDTLAFAGALAKSGFANGMSFDVGGFSDQHAGGSDADSARTGARLFSSLTILWQWIIEQNMQDEVMIMVSHDFSRTPYNNSRTNLDTVKSITRPEDNRSELVNCPGRDHNLTFGTVFIHGKAGHNGQAMKLGAVGEGYNPFGSRDIRGTIDYNAPALRTESLVCSMLMRCYPELFPDMRLTQRIWRNFNEPLDMILG
ncbi:MAG: hypothetical protein OXT67_12220 [Zetaproteobacteria bacterium]|nr:hypothetical protein [Zetaproteobacteria bacterium]